MAVLPSLASRSFFSPNGVFVHYPQVNAAQPLRPTHTPQPQVSNAVVAQNTGFVAAPQTVPTSAVQPAQGASRAPIGIVGGAVSLQQNSVFGGY